MAYTQYDETVPDPTDTGTTVVDNIRDNLNAMRDAIVLGSFYGWAMSLSGGTAEQPTTVTYSNGTERLRATLTWGTTGGEDGNVAKSVYCYSSDSGTSWDYVGTMNITYDINSNVTGTSWTTGDSC